MLDGPSVVAALRREGVTHVVWIPDSELGTWESALVGPEGLPLIRVCREGEAFAVAGGLCLGGQRPIVLIQCTGLFEAGDALRNLIHDLKLPLFVVIGVRNYYPHQEGKSSDSCPVFTEPIVQAWRLPYVVFTRSNTADDLASEYRKAQAEGRAGAVLLGGRSRLMMTARQALKVLAKERGQRIVITTMTAVGLWPELSDTPLDFAYLPSAMGHGPGLGLGLALAKPEHGVIVINGDGSMLMSLGSLVTLASYPAELFLVILENRLYEVTGGQATAGAGRVDFATMARAAGINRTYAFDTLEAWRDGAAEALRGPGPVVIVLKVEGRLGQKTPKAPRPMKEQIARLRGALQT